MKSKIADATDIISFRDYNAQLLLKILIKGNGPGVGEINRTADI